MLDYVLTYLKATIISDPHINVLTIMTIYLSCWWLDDPGVLMLTVYLCKLSVLKFVHLKDLHNIKDCTQYYTYTMLKRVTVEPL